MNSSACLLVCVQTLIASTCLIDAHSATFERGSLCGDMWVFVVCTDNKIQILPIDGLSHVSYHRGYLIASLSISNWTLVERPARFVVCILAINFVCFHFLKLIISLYFAALT